MNQIKVQDLGAGTQEALFEGVSFSLSDGDKIGIVGANGGGKTTLLRCIAGLIEPNQGTISRPKGQRLAFVQQTTPQEFLGLTLREVILSGLDPDERDSSAWRVDLTLDIFGAPDDTRDRAIAQLSGGWQRLALIAKAWISEPAALIMDEPTNHLDLSKILLLENWLREEIGATALLVVSHDRRFLDKCTNRTLFLRPRDSRLYAHPFSRARELRAEEDRAVANRQQRDFVEVERLRKSAHKLRQIGVNNYSAAALRKSIQIAKRADAVEESTPAVYVEARRDIRLGSRETHAKRIISAQNLTVRRPDGAALFHIRKLDVMRGERVVVLGANGTGKTQFVQRIRREFSRQAEEGAEITIAPSIVLSYIDQMMSHLPDSHTVRDYVTDHLGVEGYRAVPLLVGAGFRLAQHSVRVGSLSPGERARLALLGVRIQAPSLFLMDEPTNHLDIDGQEQLESEILSQQATSILVSHDREFVERIGTRFLVVEDTRVVEIGAPEVFYSALAANCAVSKLDAASHAI